MTNEDAQPIWSDFGTRKSIRSGILMFRLRSAWIKQVRSGFGFSTSFLPLFLKKKTHPYMTKFQKVHCLTKHRIKRSIEITFKVRLNIIYSLHK